MVLHSNLVILDGVRRHGPALKMAATRYTMGQSSQNTRGLTLLFTHCIGSHKEQWGPTIERIFRQQQLKDETHRIREAWSFDWQNHGDSAVLNHEALIARPGGVSVYEWASALAAFVRSPRMKGHRIVVLGHSAGAGAIMLSTTDFPLSEIPYAAIVLVEPAMITRELFNAHLEDRMATMNFAVSSTSVRRDTWESREAAFKWFSRRYPWNTWDSRVVRILAEQGLRDVASKVTLKCDRKQEAVSYPDAEGHFESTIILGRICCAVPVHVVWGTNNDLIPEFIQESLCDTSEGRFVASVTRVKGAGHMVRCFYLTDASSASDRHLKVVQEQPDRLADSLCEILDSVQIMEPTRSRL
ncbi:hypothetical protein DXG03_003348 [Asterophora parasitica]|uniref:AB hydrolase-1 domain-containing protein n=1 Tax=Asterophora parasitica TaxID=117018 RepID=A0A9P7G7S0_9AGAR|nr:hypothetical protein DXG03_003346 [Asterophora parasitica]KAG5642247.1 hypothetical protein DXG03_003348 [Asterophora parasitica]